MRPLLALWVLARSQSGEDPAKLLETEQCAKNIRAWLTRLGQTKRPVRLSVPAPRLAKPADDLEAARDAQGELLALVKGNMDLIRAALLTCVPGERDEARPVSPARRAVGV